VQGVILILTENKGLSLYYNYWS